MVLRRLFEHILCGTTYQVTGYHEPLMGTQIANQWAYGPYHKEELQFSLPSPQF
jgi:hypothetical protein